MATLEVQLFQIPVVRLDGEVVTFPFKRVDGLFYYLICTKSATRQELAALLWGECAEDVAYKNLRHTLYTLRKCLGSDIILTDQKTAVTLNPERRIVCDFDPGDLSQMLTADVAQFLRGFSIKNAPGFNAWVETMRDSFHHQLLKGLSHGAATAFALQDLNEAEEMAQRYLSVDGLDERMIMFLMRLYQQDGQYYKAVKLYQKLKAKLSSELGIAPQQETTLLYYEVVKQWNQTADGDEGEPTQAPIGRAEILHKMTQAYQGFLQSYGTTPSLLLYGNVGSGKTYVLEYFLQSGYFDDVFLLLGNCFRQEKEGYLEAWKSVMISVADCVLEHKLHVPEQTRAVIARVFPVFADGLDELPQTRQFYRRGCDEVLAEAVSLLLSIVAKRKKILLVFENLHWMDTAGQQLLIHVIRRLSDARMMVVATSRTLETELAFSLSKKELIQLEVGNFTFEDTAQYCQRALPSPPSQGAIEQIFQYTGGNPKLVADLIKQLESNGTLDGLADAKGLLHQRLAGLGEEALAFSQVLSLFEEKAPCRVLSAVTGKSLSALYDLFAELRQHDFVEEFSMGGESYLAFSHPRMREVIYQEQSYFKRQPMHQRIAQVLEEGLVQGNGAHYLSLAYHYSQAGETAKAFGYQVLCLEMYTQRFCDLLPQLHDEPCLTLPGGADIAPFIQHLEEQWEQLRRSITAAIPTEIIQRLACAKARYLIFTGEYQQGLVILNRLLEELSAQPEQSAPLLLDALQQLITYNLRVDQLEPCGSNIIRGLELAQSHGLARQRALYLLLKGMYSCRCGVYDSGEYYLKQAQMQMQRVSGCHDMSYALMHTWRGESRRMQQDFASACGEYTKAMEYIAQYAGLPGMGFICTCHARAALALGDHYKAAQLFQEALCLFEKTGALRGRSLAQAYLALYAAKNEEYDRATELLIAAKESASRLSSLQEQGIRDSVLAQLRQELDASQKTDNALHRYLYRTLDIYCNRGIQRLRGVAGAYEIEVLERCLRFSKNHAPPIRVETLYSKNKMFMTE